MSIKPAEGINKLPNELFGKIREFAGPMDKRSFRSTSRLLSKDGMGITRLPTNLVRYVLDFLTHGYEDLDFRWTCTYFRSAYPINVYAVFPVRGFVEKYGTPVSVHRLDGILAMYRKHSNIRLLGGNAIGHVTDKQLERLQGLPLESLTIASAAITNSGFKYLADLPLKNFDIQFIFSQISEQAFSSLSKLRLHSLEITAGYTEFNDNIFTIFKDMPLQRLNLQHTSLTEKSLKFLKNMPLKTLVINPLKCDHFTSDLEGYSKQLTETMKQQIPTLEECFIKAKL